MHKAGFITTLLVGALAAVTSGAAAEAAEPGSAGQADLPQLYQVEIIVFAYNHPAAGGEIFPDKLPARPSGFVHESSTLDRFDYAVAAQRIAAVTAHRRRFASGTGTTGQGTGAAMAPSAEQTVTADSQPGDSASSRTRPTETASTAAIDPAAARKRFLGPRGFHVLGDASLTLDGAYAKLKDAAAYTPLLHAAWVEPALSEDSAPKVKLAQLTTFNPAGSVRLYQRSYLHVALDLRYRPPRAQRAVIKTTLEVDQETRHSPQAAGRTGGPVAGTAAQAVQLEPITLGPILTMKQSRRIETGTIEYFDNPYFGVLLRVTPYQLMPEKQTNNVAPAA